MFGPDVRRQRDTDSLEDATDIACHRCAQDEALALLFGFDFLNAIEVHEQGAPLSRAAVRWSSNRLRKTSARNEQNTWPARCT